MTCWLLVRDPIKANFLSCVFSPLTSAEACEKVIGGFGKKSCVSTEKARNHMCVTDRYDMTLAVKVAYNPSTTNQPTASFASGVAGLNH